MYVTCSRRLVDFVRPKPMINVKPRDEFVELISNWKTRKMALKNTFTDINEQHI